MIQIRLYLTLADKAIETKLRILVVFLVIFTFSFLHNSHDLLFTDIAYCEADIEESNNILLGSTMFIGSILLYIFVAPYFFPYVDPDILMSSGVDVVNNIVTMDEFEFAPNGLFLKETKISTDHIYLNANEALEQALKMRGDIIEKLSQKYDPKIERLEFDYTELCNKYNTLVAQYFILENKYNFFFNYKVHFIDALIKADVLESDLEEKYLTLFKENKPQEFYSLLKQVLEID